ncbi:MAG TPA: dihydropteroate synthase [Acidimicrobiales bacterium]|nr:dihydropteroate synthase [Acidimicrobiales bacterium]
MQTLVMGVVNVTPDSFYDGGNHFDTDEAIAFGHQLINDGADILDIGGESSRPGATPVDEVEEFRRVLPVIRGLSPYCRVSIDTMKLNVARAAVEAGATMINDITSTLHEVAAETGAAISLMHMQGSPQSMQDRPHYDDVVGEVLDYLVRAATRAIHLGIKEIYIDPGIGFGKTTSHNVALLHALPRFVATGFSVLVGTSRKRFIGQIAAPAGSSPLELDERFEGSLASATWAMSCGVSMVRVHDVKATAQAARIVGELSGDMGDEEVA